MGMENIRFRIDNATHFATGKFTNWTNWNPLCGVESKCSLSSSRTILMNYTAKRHAQSPPKINQCIWNNGTFCDFGKVAQFRFIEVEGLFKLKAIYGIKPFIFTNHHLLLLLAQIPSKMCTPLRFLYVCVCFVCWNFSVFGFCFELDVIHSSSVRRLIRFVRRDVLLDVFVVLASMLLHLSFITFNAFWKMYGNNKHQYDLQCANKKKIEKNINQD